MKDAIRAEGVCLERDGRRILDGITWRVPAGSRWVLFGPNGAGKTSLLMAVLGYVWPTEGRVFLAGHQLGTVNLEEVRRKVALVSHRLYELVNEDLTGAEVIVTGARSHFNLFAPPTPGEAGSAQRLGERFGLGPLMRKPFRTMSTGERQRVMIARALMASPSLVIFDEPCAGLDLGGRELVMKTINTLQAGGGSIATVLTTHHLEEIGPRFTHALILKQGRVAASGKIERVMTTANLSDLFDMPLEVTRSNGRWGAGLKT